MDVVVLIVVVVGNYSGRHTNQRNVRAITIGKSQRMNRGRGRVRGGDLEKHSTLIAREWPRRLKSALTY